MPGSARLIDMASMLKSRFNGLAAATRSLAGPLALLSLFASGCGKALEVTPPKSQSTSTQSPKSTSEPSPSSTQSTGESTQAGPACALAPSKASFGSWIDQRCEQMFNCCQAPELASLLGAEVKDQGSCKRSLTAALQSKQSSAANAQIMAKLDSEFAAALYLISTDATQVRSGCLASCLESQKAQGCNKDAENQRCSAPDNYPGGPCDPHLIFEGVLGENDACDPALVEADLDVQCSYGLDCKPRSDGSHRCTPVSALGQACRVNADDPQGSCEYDAVCHPESKTCIKGAQVGEACEHSDTKAFVGCRPGLDCGIDKRCVPPCQAGASCVNVRRTSDDRLCPEHFSCYPGDFPHCKALDKGASSCDSDGDCGSTAFCSSALENDSPEGSPLPGVCKVRLASGSCTRDRECVATSFCTRDGQCKAKLAEDQACTSSTQCSAAAPLCASVDKDAAGTSHALKSVCIKGPRDTETCLVKDAALREAKAYQFYLRPEILRVQNPNAPWLSICKTGGCENTTGAEDRCVAYASAGQACDHLPGEGAASCAPGLHCVSGICKAFAKNGEACDPASESWNAQDLPYRQGFPSALCNPEQSRCIQTVAGSHCHIDPQRRGQAICRGKEQP